MDSVSDEKVKITISSDPTTFEINIGDLEKIDLNSDGSYDLSVFLETSNFYRATFILTLIDEAIITNTPEEVAREAKSALF